MVVFQKRQKVTWMCRVGVAISLTIVASGAFTWVGPLEVAILVIVITFRALLPRRVSKVSTITWMRRDPRNCRRFGSLVVLSRLRSPNNHMNGACPRSDPHNCRCFWSLVSVMFVSCQRVVSSVVSSLRVISLCRVLMYHVVSSCRVSRPSCLCRCFVLRPSSCPRVGCLFVSYTHVFMWRRFVFLCRVFLSRVLACLISLCHISVSSCRVVVSVLCPPLVLLSCFRVEASLPNFVTCVSIRVHGAYQV